MSPPRGWAAGRAGTALAGVLLLLAIPACRPAADRAADAVAQADAALAANDQPGAFRALGRATALDPDNVDAWLKLGTLQLRSGDATAADQSFQRAQELAPDNIEALQNLVVLSVRGEELDRAKRYMDPLLVLQPDDPAGLLAQGAIALRERRAADALAVASRLAAAYPDIAEGSELRARALVALGRRAEAIKALEAWLASHSASAGYSDVLLLLLEQYRQAGDVAGVRATALRLHAALPDDPRYAFESARALRARGQGETAEGIVARLLHAHPDAPGLVRAALRYWQDTLPPGEARARALALAAGASPATRLVIANGQIDAGRPADALTLATPLAGRKVGPDTEDAAATVARALAALGRADAARARADAVLAFDEGNVPALLVRAALNLDARRFDAAIADAQQAQSGDATSEAAAALLPRIYAAQGDAVLAQRAYALAVQHFPDSYPLTAAYLDWLVGAGREREAMVVAGSFARRHRRHAPAWRRFADLCARQSDPCLAEAQAGLAAAG